MTEPLSVIIVCNSPDLYPELAGLRADITERFAGTEVKTFSLEKLTIIIDNINPNRHSVLLLTTRNVAPSPQLATQLARLQGTNTQILMYPQPVIQPNPKANVAASKKAIFEGIAQQWYSANRQAAPRSTVMQQQPSFSVDQRLPNKASATLLIVDILKSSDQQFGLGMNNLRLKHSQSPGLQFRDINNLGEIAAKPGQRHILIVSSAEADRVAYDINRLPNRESIFAILCKGGSPTDSRQYFNLVTSNLQAIDSHIYNTLKSLQQTTSNIPGSQQSSNIFQMPAGSINIEGKGGQRSVSAPLKSNPNEMRRSQIKYVNQQGEIVNRRISNMPQMPPPSQISLTGPPSPDFNNTAAKFIQPMSASTGYSQISPQYNQYFSINPPAFSQEPPQLNKRTSSSADSNLRIKMESTRKINSNRLISPAGGEAKVFIYEPGNDPNFTNFYSCIGFMNPPAILKDLNPQIAFPPGSILLASYDMRRQIAPSLNNLNSHVCCVLYGKELLPDNIINQQQIQLITYNPLQVRDFLASQGVKIGNVPLAAAGFKLPIAVPQPSPESRIKGNLPTQSNISREPKSVKFLQQANPSSQSMVPQSNIYVDQLASAGPFAKEWVVKKKPNAGFFAIIPAGQDEREYFRHPTLTLRVNPNRWQNPNITEHQSAMEPQIGSMSPEMVKKFESAPPDVIAQRMMSITPSWEAPPKNLPRLESLPSMDESQDMRQRTSIQVHNITPLNPNFSWQPAAPSSGHANLFPNAIPMTQSIQAPQNVPSILPVQPLQPPPPPLSPAHHTVVSQKPPSPVTRLQSQQSGAERSPNQPQMVASNEYSPSQININSKQSMLKGLALQKSPSNPPNFGSQGVPQQVSAQQQSQQMQFQPSQQQQQSTTLKRPTSRKIINLAEVSLPSSSQPTKYSSPSALVLSSIPDGLNQKTKAPSKTEEPSPLAKHMSQTATNQPASNQPNPYDNPSMLSEHSNFNSGSENSSGIEDKRFGLGKKKTKNGFESKNGYQSQIPQPPQPPLDPVAQEKWESFRAEDEGRARIHTFSNNSANTKFNYRIPVGEAEPRANQPPGAQKPMLSNGNSKINLTKKQSIQTPTSPKSPVAGPLGNHPTRDRNQFSFSGPTANTFNNYYATGTLADDPDWYDPKQYEKRYENGRIIYIRHVDVNQKVKEQSSDHSEANSRTNYHVHAPSKFKPDNYYLGATKVGEPAYQYEDMIKTVPVKGLDSNKEFSKRMENGVAVYSRKSTDRKTSQDGPIEGRRSQRNRSNPSSDAYLRQYKSVAHQPQHQNGIYLYPPSADAAEDASILYVIPQGMENLRSRLSRMCTPNDKLQTYYRPQELQKLKAGDYDVVLVFPRDKDSVPEPPEENVFIVRMLKSIKQNSPQELYINDLNELHQLIYTAAPGKKLASSVSLGGRTGSQKHIQDMILDYSDRPKLLFSVAQTELARKVAKKLALRVTPVKYYDTWSLMERVRQLCRQNLVVVLNGSMMRNIGQIKSISPNAQIIVFDRFAKQAVSRDSDVRVVTTLQDLLNTVKQMY